MKRVQSFGLSSRRFFLTMSVFILFHFSAALAFSAVLENSTAAVVVVHSIGANARDFPNFQEWENARQGDLITRRYFAISNQSRMFVGGEKIIGVISRAEGKYLKERDRPSSSETNMSLDAVLGVFQEGEAVVGVTSGASARLDTILSRTGTIEKGEAYADGIFDAGVLIQGSTTDASHYMWLSAAPSQHHKGLAGGGVRLDPIALGHVIHIADHYSRVEGLEITGWPNRSGSASWEGVHVAANQVVLNQLLIHDDDFVGYDNPNSDAISLNDMASGHTVTIRNSMIYNIGRGAINYQELNAITVNIQNVTVFNTGLTGSQADGQGGIYSESPTAILNTVNTISMGSGSGSDFNHPGSWGTSSNNLSSDSSAPGPLSIIAISASSQFVSIAPGTIDLHLQASAVAVGLGANLGIAFSDDVDGMSRIVPWDIGADEFRDEIFTITTETLPTGSVGKPYRELLSVSGGKSPYLWRVVSGFLPEGIALSKDGILSGTPLLQGKATFAVEVVDVNTRSATKNLAIDIANTADTTAPLLSNVRVVSIQADSATIAWTTDEPADSEIQYGREISYGQSIKNASRVTSHSLTLTNLSSGTIYHYKIITKDASGNAATSLDATLKTTPPPDIEPPSPPLNVLATSLSTSQIQLQWTPSTDNVAVVEYRLYRNSVEVGRTTTNTFTDINLLPNTQYAYQLRAFDVAGNASLPSAMLTVTTLVLSDITPPSIPSNLGAVSVSISQINLSWSAATDNIKVTGYKVFRDGVVIGQTTATTYSDKGLLPATLYRYSVSAYDAAGNQSAQLPWVSLSTLYQIRLKWNASTDNVGVAGYRIFRNDILIGISPTTSYLDAGLLPGTVQVYRVSAFDAAGNESQRSEALSVVVGLASDPEIPSTPTNLSATAESGNRIALRWTASTDNVGVVAYKIYRDGLEIGVSTTTSFSSGGLLENTSYTYRVSAVDAAGNISAQSASASAKTGTSETLVLSNLNVTSGQVYAVVSKGLANGATVYIDRNYGFSGLPSTVLGASYIKTANDDKNWIGENFIAFDLNRSATLYLAHDNRILPKPSWMSGFISTGESVPIAGEIHGLWKKTVSAGRIVLGGNGGGKSSSMYSVFIVP